MVGDAVYLYKWNTATGGYPNVQKIRVELASRSKPWVMRINIWAKNVASSYKPKFDKYRRSEQTNVLRKKQRVQKD
jgi:hypothetical protein